MNAHRTPEEIRASRMTREQVADLLNRYPHVSNVEAEAIVAFLRRGRHLDIGILTADEKLKPRLDAFMEQHARHFRVSIGEAAAVIAAIAGLLVACWLVWETIKPGAA